MQVAWQIIKDQLLDLSDRSSFALGLVGELGAGKSYGLAALLQELPLAWLVVEAATPLEQLILPKLGKISQLKDLGRQLRQQAPIILVIENLQLANPKQQSLWFTLAQQLQGSQGIALLFMARATLPSPISSVVLIPFSMIQTIMLLENQAGTVLPEAATDWIYQRSLGNPLFALEFFRWLAQSGHLRSDGLHWQWREPEVLNVPIRIAALIEQTLLEVLASQTRTKALTSAALLGSAFDLANWAKVMACSVIQAQQQMLEFEQLGLMRNKQFVHPLYAEVLLKHCPKADLQRISRIVLPLLRLHQPIRAVEILPLADLSPSQESEYLEAAMRQAAEQKNLILLVQLKTRQALMLESTAQIEALFELANWLKAYHLTQALKVVELILQFDSAHQKALYLQLELLAYLGQVQEIRRLQVPAELEWMVLDRTFDLLRLLHFWQTKLGGQYQLAPAVARAVAEALIQQQDHEQAQKIWQSSTALPQESKLLAAPLELLKAQCLLAKKDFLMVINQTSLLLDFLLEQNRHLQVLDLLEATYRTRALAYRALGQLEPAITDTQAGLQILQDLGHTTLVAYHQTTLVGYFLEAGEQTKASLVLEQARIRLEDTDVPVYAYGVQKARTRLLLEQKDPKAINLARLAWRSAQQTQIRCLQQEAHELYCLTQASLGSVAKAFDDLETFDFPSQHLIKAIAFERIGQPQAAAQQLELAKATTPRHEPLLQANLEWLQAPPVGISVNPILEVLGEIRWNGVRLAERGPKALELLVYLLEARVLSNQTVSSHELCLALYPNQDVEKANTALKQLVYRMRSYLGAQAIVRQQDGYGLGDFSSDLEQFLVNPNPEVWQGQYLQDLGTHNSRLILHISQTMQKLIKTMIHQKHSETMRIATILIELQDPSVETLTMILIAAKQNQDTVSAMQFYERAKNRFAELGEELPSSWQEFLATSVTERYSFKAR